LSSTAQGRILALDYGRAHCGCALSDPLGTIASPLEPISDAASEGGHRQVAALVAEHDVRAVLVGLPVGLSGERGAQARETLAFVERLRAVLPVPVETHDERFTSAIARRTPGSASEHSRAAAHLLSEYLRISAARSQEQG
jgi:putative Holliday junction resolvase